MSRNKVHNLKISAQPSQNKKILDILTRIKIISLDKILFFAVYGEQERLSGAIWKKKQNLN